LIDRVLLKVHEIGVSRQNAIGYELQLLFLPWPLIMGHIQDAPGGVRIDKSWTVNELCHDLSELGPLHHLPPSNF